MGFGLGFLRKLSYKQTYPGQTRYICLVSVGFGLSSYASLYKQTYPEKVHRFGLAGFGLSSYASWYNKTDIPKADKVHRFGFVGFGLGFLRKLTYKQTYPDKVHMFGVVGLDMVWSCLHCTERRVPHGLQKGNPTLSSYAEQWPRSARHT